MRKLTVCRSLASLATAVLLAAQHSPLFSKDYVECSAIADKKASRMSDVMYLGIFYGCMTERGYDVNTLL